MDIGILRPATLPLIITGDTLVEVDLDHKIPYNIPISIG